MPELGPYGSVRGAAGNSRPYRECRPPTNRAACSSGRRTKASKGGNRAGGNEWVCCGRYGDLIGADEVPEL
jgi:hypothetical protein